MNRRDYFAAAALQGLLAHSFRDNEANGYSWVASNETARMAVEYADATLRLLDEEKISPAPADREEGCPPARSKAAGVGEVASEEGAPRCTRCDGCGQIADNEEGAPWSAWAELPPGSDVAVRAGLVKPIECPACHGTKVAR